MKHITLLLLALCITTALCAQTIENVTVKITPSLQEEGESAYSGKPLTWDQFKGKPDNSCGFVAMTYSGIKMRYTYATRNGVTTATVQLCPYMQEDLSWFKQEGHDDYTLAHEQKHFDITAIVTQEFAAELKKRSFNVSTFSAELKKMHAAYLHKLAQMQAKYDEETEHGVNTERQNQWSKQLSEEMRRAGVGA
jgi:hypothetical protein